MTEIESFYITIDCPECGRRLVPAFGNAYNGYFTCIYCEIDYVARERIVELAGLEIREDKKNGGGR